MIQEKKVMGRPKKDEKEVLSKFVLVRLTEDDYDSINQIAKIDNRSVSDCIRGLIHEEIEAAIRHGDIYRR